ncbi:hypothetical protein MmTuc01_0488 [Methanosarcina mazei Tuc01]|uniref:Uncharacterized protein n=1 Tax=Methanosarcina mazei Tuc01 TaxID=1236903 RepID=M1Q0Y2_METMZ|nr:hypothetical protein MmTuc01_0488 [Methanosarcina mazei Tuc01]
MHRVNSGICSFMCLLCLDFIFDACYGSGSRHQIRLDCPQAPNLHNVK